MCVGVDMQLCLYAMKLSYCPVDLIVPRERMRSPQPTRNYPVDIPTWSSLTQSYPAPQAEFKASSEDSWLAFLIANPARTGKYTYA